MIHVDPVPRPDEWDAIEARGATWLDSHPTGRPPPYWRACARQLALGFHDRCGWTAMNTPHGGVEHFTPIAKDRSRAYDWSNLRYASGFANSRKGDAEVLDPYEVDDDWFELVWPSLELRLTDAVPPELRPIAEFTVRRLGLRDDEAIIRYRRSWLERYEQGIPLDQIRELAPLVARLIERTRIVES